MNTIQRIAKNMAVLFLARIASTLFGFFYVMYTARYLGPTNYGILAFALALNGIFGVITNFGFDPLTVREVARNKSLAKKYLANGIALKLLFGTLTFLVVTLVVNLLGYPEVTVKVVYLVTFSTIMAGVNNLFNDIYQAFEKMEFMSIGQILSSALSLAFALVGIKLNLDVLYFSMVYLIVNLIVLSYHIAVMIWKFVMPSIEVDVRFWRNVLREAWPFALTAMFISIYYWIDSVMLSYIKGDEVVGWYNAAYRLVINLSFIPGIVNMVVFPVMSIFHISSKHSLHLVFEKYFKFMLAIGIPLGIGTTLLADRIIVTIFSSEYIPSIQALQVLIWAMVCVFAKLPFVRLLESIDKQSIVAKVTGIGMVENVILNLMIIPKFSYIGASITTLITEITVTTLVIASVYKSGYGIRKKHFLMYISKPFISSGLMGFFVWRLSHVTRNLMILIVLSIFLYSGGMFIIKGIDKEDLGYLSKLKVR